MIELHNIVILERSMVPGGDANMPGRLRYVERHRDEIALIESADLKHGRKRSRERIERRFDNGFRYVTLENDGGPVAWFWALVGGVRYLDELRWSIALDHDQVWARDAFVVPELRGRRMLLALMTAAAAAEGRAMRVYSDVDAVNLPSLRAHAAMGFRRICTVRALTLADRLTLRSRAPACLSLPAAIRPMQRVLWLSPGEHAWHLAQIA